MTEPAPELTDLSVEEYLALEERGLVRHEYVAGAVYAMTGGTLRHNLIAANILTKLRAAAGAGPCRAFINDVKVRVTGDLFYYPDNVVTCVPVDDGAVYLDEPCLIVEVTSPSTESVDRREKLVAYRQIASLRAYLIVSHRRRAVEVHVRDASGAWRSGRVTDGDVDIPCPATRLALDDVYAGVTLPAVSEPGPADYDV